MKRKIGLLAICIGIAFVIILATQAQRPGGAGAQAGAQGGAQRMGGQMMRMGSGIEGSWAFVSFQLDLTDEKLLSLRKIYKVSWDESRKLTTKLAEARTSGDRDAMQALMEESTKIKTDLDAKLKEALAPEQFEKLTKWEKEETSRMRPAGGPPGGGAPPAPPR